MKKIICEKGDYGDSINFVDKNNVFVGYNTDRQYRCCELPGYSFISGNFEIRTFQPENIRDYKIKIGEELKLSESDLDKYVFDINGNVPECRDEREDDGSDEYMRLKLFRLYDPNNIEDVIYLVLYNFHNGYYHHGFEVKQNDEVIEKGCL